MNSRRTGLQVAGTLFAIFCLIHLWRLLAKVDVVIGQRHVPFLVSVVAIVIAGALSLWMWKLAAEER